MNCFGNCVEYRYEHKSAPTTNYPQGFTESGRAVAFKSRNGMEIFHAGNRNCNSSGSGKVYRHDSIQTHPDGEMTYQSNDNRGTALCGNVEMGNGGKSATITSLGKVGSFGPGRHNVVTNMSTDSKGAISSTSTINGQTLSTTRYEPVRRCSPNDSSVASAVNQHFGVGCQTQPGPVPINGGGFTALWIIVIIIIIIIIIAIIAWAARGNRRSYMSKQMMGEYGMMGDPGMMGQGMMGQGMY